MDGDITLLLQQWKQGKDAALSQLLPVVYESLRSIAMSQLRREQAGHTLQATALVHELYLRLVQQHKLEWKDRAHFFTFSAKMMRLILIDHARALRAEKRGGQVVHVGFFEDLPWFTPTEEGLLDLEQALQELEQLDPDKARLVEIRFFLGCTAQETADMMGVSKATVDRDLKFIRAWLHHRLSANNL